MRREDRTHQSLDSFHGIFSASSEMQELFEVIERVGRSESTVLVRGETGTGKELVAKALVASSSRAKKPFRAINCATLTPDLLASELFGHKKGSFTGAVRDHQGLFSQAHTGTIFLDEVAELPLGLQSQLLRVLQERSFVPVGGTEPQEVDVRVIAATNKALRSLVAQGRFREDLMYRIRVIPIFLPPLAQRKGDVKALLWKFIGDFNDTGHRTIESIAEDALAMLLAYGWPGNVRELHNVVEFAFVMGTTKQLLVGDLPPELRGDPPTAERNSGDESEEIRHALQEAGGRKGEAARQLGMSRSTLWRKMKGYRIA